MINLSMHLYEKPAWDMNIEGNDNIDPEMLRKQGTNLKEHLHNVADIVKKLQAKGWEIYGTLYTLDFSHPKIKTEEQAKRELEKLGIPINEICFMDFEED